MRKNKNELIKDYKEKQKEKIPRKIEKREEITFDDAIKIYTKQATLENLTPNTIRINIGHFNTMRKFFLSIDINFFSDIKREDLETYIMEKLRNSKTKPQTINKNLKILKSFYKRIIKDGKEIHNCVEDITLLKEDRFEVKPFTLSDVEKILNFPNVNTFTGLRMRTLLTLAFDTGMRVGEIIDLKISDINFTDRIFSLEKTKSRHERLVPFSLELKRILQQYIYYREKYVQNNSPYLFVSLNTGEKITRETISSYLDRMKEKIIISGGSLNMHRFRHTFCYFFINSGGDPFVLKKIVGHESILTTQRYVNMQTGDILKSHDKYNVFTRLAREKC